MNTEILIYSLIRKLERAIKKLVRPFIMRRLERKNLYSKKSVLGEANVAVSLTTFGERLDKSFYTIESIADGDIRPKRLAVYLDKKSQGQSLPQSLIRLQKRGLTIEYVEDVGPHTKYFPEIMNNDFLEMPFVTADDDILYPKYWLKKLYSKHQIFPNEILCFRAHSIKIEQDRMAEYNRWNKCYSDEPSRLNFSTGVCGVLFPQSMRTALIAEGLKFQDFCPKADDIWLNLIALRHDILVRQIVKVAKRFYEIPGTRSGALADYNNGQGGNDIQLKLSYTDSDLHKLHST